MNSIEILLIDVYHTFSSVVIAPIKCCEFQPQTSSSGSKADICSVVEKIHVDPQRKVSLVHYVVVGATVSHHYTWERFNLKTEYKIEFLDPFKREHYVLGLKSS